MHLVAASDEAAVAVGFESFAEDLCFPLGCCRLATPASILEYTNPPSVGPSCRLLCAAISPVVPWASVRSPNRCLGAWRWLAGSDGQSELEISSPFLLLAWSCRVAGVPCLTTKSAGTLKCRSARSTSFSGHKGLLLASRHCLPQFPQKYWGKLYFADSLNTG